MKREISLNYFNELIDKKIKVCFMRKWIQYEF